MSNEITRNINNFANNINSAIRKNNSAVEKNAPQVQQTKSGIDSMSFLGSYGCAKVNMDKNLDVRHSVETFMADPFRAELHTDLCDDFVSRGYNLEDAIQVTEGIFETLEDKNTYN